MITETLKRQHTLKEHHKTSLILFVIKESVYSCSKHLWTQGQSCYVILLSHVRHSVRVSEAIRLADKQIHLEKSEPTAIESTTIGHLSLPCDGVETSSENSCSYVTSRSSHTGNSGPIVCSDVIDLNRVEVRDTIKASYYIDVVVE